MGSPNPQSTKMKVGAERRAAARKPRIFGGDVFAKAERKMPNRARLIAEIELRKLVNPFTLRPSPMVSRKFQT